MKSASRPNRPAAPESRSPDKWVAVIVAGALAVVAAPTVIKAHTSPSDPARAPLESLTPPALTAVPRHDAPPQLPGHPPAAQSGGEVAAAAGAP